MDIRNEKGFTLMEMILVLAILIIFMAAMTSLMLTTTNMTTKVTQTNEAKNVNTLLIPHIERSIEENEVKGAIHIISSGTYHPILEIDTDPGNINSVKLYYFYEKNDQGIYFQAAQKLDTANKNASVEVANHVTKFDITLSSVQKALRVKVTVKVPDGTKEYANTIALKTY